MLKNRFFNVLIAIALVMVIALTIREAFATGSVISQKDAAKEAKRLECASLPPQYSIHTEYMEEMGTWLPQSEDGPTGVHGGLIYLLSNYRTCSSQGE